MKKNLSTSDLIENEKKAKKRLGSWGEEQARIYLIAQGFQLLHRNWRLGIGGEIDLIVCDDDFLVFVEVKTRQENSFIPAELNISIKQQKKLIEMADKYLNYFPNFSQSVRFDSIGVTLLTDQTYKIVHIKEIFHSW